MALVKRYTPLDVTTPPGTDVATPQIVTWDDGDVWLYAVQLRIPPGHGGQTGILLSLAGTQIIPWSNVTAWVNGDDDYFEFEVGAEVGNGLQIVTYNGDVWPHSHYLRFVNNPISVVTVPALTAVVPVV